MSSRHGKSNPQVKCFCKDLGKTLALISTFSPVGWNCLTMTDSIMPTHTRCTGHLLFYANTHKVHWSSSNLYQHTQGALVIFYFIPTHTRCTGHLLFYTNTHKVHWSSSILYQHTQGALVIFYFMPTHTRCTGHLLFYTNTHTVHWSSSIFFIHNTHI